MFINGERICNSDFSATRKAGYSIGEVLRISSLSLHQTPALRSYLTLGKSFELWAPIFRIVGMIVISASNSHCRDQTVYACLAQTARLSKCLLCMLLLCVEDILLDSGNREKVPSQKSHHTSVSSLRLPVEA